MTPHTRASRAAVVVTAVLAGLQFLWAGFRAEGNDIVGLSALLGALTLSAAFALAHLNAFEARLAACFMAGAQVALMLLALVWGLPGHDRHPIDRQAVVALVVPAAVLVLLAVDRRRRGLTAPRDERPPYAL